MRKGQILVDIVNSFVLNNNFKEDKILIIIEEGFKEEDRSKEFKEIQDKIKKQKSKKYIFIEKVSKEKFVKVINRKFQIGKVFMIFLKDRFVRYRFIGLEFQKILVQIFRIVDIMFNNKEIFYWWKEYYEDKKYFLDFNQQREFWDGVVYCQFVVELFFYVVIGLIVRDLRVIRVMKRNENFDIVLGKRFLQNFQMEFRDVCIYGLINIYSDKYFKLVDVFMCLLLKEYILIYKLFYMYVFIY